MSLREPIVTRYNADTALVAAGVAPLRSYRPKKGTPLPWSVLDAGPDGTSFLTGQSTHTKQAITLTVFHRTLELAIAAGKLIEAAFPRGVELTIDGRTLVELTYLDRTEFEESDTPGVYRSMVRFEASMRKDG